MRIPEYFVYNQAQHGYYPIQNSVTSKNQSITFTYKDRTGDRVTTTQTYTSKVDYTETCYQYFASNIPAFPDEKFLRTKDNYLSRVKFELQSTKFPDSPFKTFTTSWEEVDRELAESFYFGKVLRRNGHLEDDAKLIKGKGLQNEALLTEALSHMKKQISWDGVNSKYLTGTLSKAYKTKQGNSADVNLNLVALLQELGFQSYPVILSTQQNGFIHPAHPSLTSFNYVIAMAVCNDKTYLMDATDPHSLLNLLPVRCLNDKGRIIGDAPEKWINLMNYKSFVAQATYEMTIDSSLSLIGRVKKNLGEYGAYEYRSAITASDDAGKTAKKMEEQTGCSVDSIKITGLDSLSNSLTVVYNLSKTDGTNASGGMVYFTPDLDPFFKENPFKLEKREFPIEFNYPYRIQQIYSYKIPDNYEITEIPKPVAIKLPNGNGNFFFQTSRQGNTVIVSSTISIRNSLFLPDEYEALKKFFQSIVDKHSEFILLKSI